jgi:hypothetical protein
MKSFAEIYPSQSLGQLEMFDRMVFQGHLSGLYRTNTFEWYLYQQGIKLTEYKGYAEKVTQQIKDHLEQVAAEAGRKIDYWQGGYQKQRKSKEEVVRGWVEQAGIKQGLIGIIGTLEMNSVFTIRKNNQTGYLEKRVEQRRCRHYYVYYLDEEFGQMYVRVQAWFPFEIQIYINGREWLARQLDQQGIRYDKVDNCFWWIEQVAEAQALGQKFAHREWPRVWNNFARRLNPWLGLIEQTIGRGYYWSINQAEIATDIMFADQTVLAEALPSLFQEALLTFSASDVMRFLGRKLNGNFQGEVKTDLKKRQPGWRVKHWVKQNSLKMYNRGPVLRLETTINNSREFRIVDEQTPSRRWKPMPKGATNAWHFYQVGCQANQRYLEAIINLPYQSKAEQQALTRLCQPQPPDQGRPIAKFNPLSDQDCCIFAAILSGDHLLHGFRNCHLRQSLYPQPPTSAQDENRLRARISRLLAKLRGHGLIEKIQHAHLYRVTAYGFRVLAPILRFRSVDFSTDFCLS